MTCVLYACVQDHFLFHTDCDRWVMVLGKLCTNSCLGSLSEVRIVCVCAGSLPLPEADRSPDGQLWSCAWLARRERHLVKCFVYLRFRVPSGRSTVVPNLMDFHWGRHWSSDIKKNPCTIAHSQCSLLSLSKLITYILYSIIYRSQYYRSFKLFVCCKFVGFK